MVFTVMTDSEVQHVVGDTCHLRLDGEYVHMFDAQTGLSLAD
jgi:hypothetical protein